MNQVRKLQDVIDVTVLPVLDRCCRPRSVADRMSRSQTGRRRRPCTSD